MSVLTSAVLPRAREIHGFTALHDDLVGVGSSQHVDIDHLRSRHGILGIHQRSNHPRTRPWMEDGLLRHFPTQRRRTRPRSTMITSYDSRTDVNNALLLPGNRRT